MFKPILNGRFYRLESLSATHENGLQQVAQDPNLWTLVKPKTQNLEAFLQQYFNVMNDKHRQQRDPFTYVVIGNATDAILGSTRYYEISPENKRLAIGYTWYHPSVWGSGINAEAKYLLLSQVFDELKWNRVVFHVDSRNSRSISAMTRLGAIQEGILRQHKIVQGNYVRDTVLFSIIKSGWLTVKEDLLKRVRVNNSNMNKK